MCVQRLWHENKNVSYRSFYHFLGYNIQLLFSEGNKNLVGESLLGGIFQSGSEWANFPQVGGNPPHPQFGKSWTAAVFLYAKSGTRSDKKLLILAFFLELIVNPNLSGIFGGW